MCTSLAQRAWRLGLMCVPRWRSAALAWRLGLMCVPRSRSGLTGLRPIFFSPTRLDKRKPVTNGNRIRTFVGTKGDYAHQRGTH
jgi:hypothetical protein